ncbi:MAG: hypothetical protein ACE5G1_06155, partial [bacterium]
MEKAKGIVWDLSSLYSASDDPQIERDIESAIESSKLFQSNFHNQIAAQDCSPERLLEALIAYEGLIEKAYQPYAMANLLFTGDGRNDA